ncbi:MAG: hypothetical protein AAGI23_09560 [Bacteroidota bacterium]
MKDITIQITKTDTQLLSEVYGTHEQLAELLYMEAMNDDRFGSILMKAGFMYVTSVQENETTNIDTSIGELAPTGGYTIDDLPF